MPLYAFLASLILAVPVYAVLYATSLFIPMYLILLTIGIAGLSLFLQRSKGFWLEEVFSLMTLIVGTACFFIGFAIAPLFVQIIGAMAIFAVFQFYWADVRVG
ncbi:hypothetical protein H6G89_30895 [Oscillatoria sp. FACHB-1407]|uniref:hypothetical protein n=1 Tax=Oscillatoria sp. FACHB-1407 TaxID=2692847 RepID=UPI0016854EA5|nr:hypothetical protein [Oscillatoria sp. FACHB-1407]MBD2465418.1 hypothetical protein [Oscillatoria sp. FACHB-1407]